MEHEYIKYLKEHNPAIRLFRQDNAALIISFLFNAFKIRNRLTIPYSEMVSLLSDYLYRLNQDNESYPLSAHSYLDKWSNDGFLRAWYENNVDEPTFELTPGMEKALEWVSDLDKRDFVGTESRLLNVFNMLKEIVYKTSDDPQKRLKELQKRKTLIEIEIEQINSGNFHILDETRIKEYFLELQDTAKKILSDFRQIEQNFRELDQEARKKLIDGNISKGKLLDDIFKAHDLIWETDQGKSFNAFWEYLMSQSRQDELKELIEIVLSMKEVQELRKENILERLKTNLIESGDKVNKSISQLIEQLRKFLDSQYYLENKRILDIIKLIQSIAIQIKNKPPLNKDFFVIDDKPLLEFIMEKPLFIPPRNIEINDTDIFEGEEDINTDLLYQQLFINPDDLKSRINALLRYNNQVSLKEVVEKYPVEKGLSEIITYFSIASKDPRAIINEKEHEKLIIYNDKTNRYSEVELPQTIFCK